MDSLASAHQMPYRSLVVFCYSISLAYSHKQRCALHIAVLEVKEQRVLVIAELHQAALLCN